MAMSQVVCSLLGINIFSIVVVYFYSMADSLCSLTSCIGVASEKVGCNQEV